jgi:hypothetical protein
MAADSSMIGPAKHRSATRSALTITLRQSAVMWLAIAALAWVVYPRTFIRPNRNVAPGTVCS